jgi:hypothetical protein
MTKQIPDLVIYKGQEFILAGLKGARLFTPTDFGISSEMMGITTACYRRYFCEYACLEHQLLLVKFSIIQAEGVEPPLIEGISAISDSIGFAHSYENLRIPCLFSGGLILVRNPVTLVGHFPSPMEFEEVVEIFFENGQVQQEIDHSTAVAELRKQIDNFSSALESQDGLSEIRRKWDSPNEKLSNQEKDQAEEYISKIVEKSIDLEWSFVSGYEQQPTI